MSQLIR